MSLLSAPLPPTLAQNPSHPFSYHHLLPLTSLATLTAIIHPGTPTHRKTNHIYLIVGKYLFDWLLSSDLLPLNNPEHHTLLHRATGNRSSPDLSLVPARMPLNAHGRPFRTSAQIIFLSPSLFPLPP